MKLTMLPAPWAVCNGRRQRTASWVDPWPVTCTGCSEGPWRQTFALDIPVSYTGPNLRFQTGTWRALGKPQGTVARVHIGHVITSIRTKLQNKEHVTEALRGARLRFPGRQKIHISRKWGFAKFKAGEFEDRVAEKRLVPDGCGLQYIPNCCL